MKDILKVDGLFFRYKDTSELILKDINFSLKKGEILAIVGPSGCGKSTLLNLIAGFLKASEGEVNIISNGNEQRFSYVFQEDALFPWRTVEENINLVKSLDRNGLTEDEICIYLRKFHLDRSVLDKYPSELSGGMRQRVSIIQSLAIEPTIFLMDEPFSSLDFYTKLKLEMDFYQLIKESGKSALLVTHDLDGAIALADRIIIISGSPASIVGVQYLFENYDRRPSPEEARTRPEVTKYFSSIWEHLKLGGTDS